MSQLSARARTFLQNAKPERHPKLSDPSFPEHRQATHQNWARSAYNLKGLFNRSESYHAEMRYLELSAPHSSKEHLLIYIHGGGYVLGSPETHGSMTLPWILDPKEGDISAKLQVFVPDYPLAPEHPFPAAIEALHAFLLSLVKSGHDPKQITICGDSAGGALALELTQFLVQQQISINSLILISPWLDLTQSGSSHQTLKEFDPMVEWEPTLIDWIDGYRGAASTSDPRLSPLFGSFQNLPRTLIQVGSREILLSDSIRCAALLREAKIEVELDVYDSMWHVFQADPRLPESKKAFEQMKRFVMKSL